MKFIKRKVRIQLEIICLELMISDDNEIRLIDLSIDLLKMAFRRTGVR